QTTGRLRRLSRLEELVDAFAVERQLYVQMVIVFKPWRAEGKRSIVGSGQRQRDRLQSLVVITAPVEQSLYESRRRMVVQVVDEFDIPFQNRRYLLIQGLERLAPRFAQKHAVKRADGLGELDHVSQAFCSALEKTFALLDPPAFKIDKGSAEHRGVLNRRRVHVGRRYVRPHDLYVRVRYVHRRRVRRNKVRPRVPAVE